MAVIKFLLPLGYAMTAAAHGRVSEVIVNGVAYEGYNSPAWANNPNPPNVFAWTIQQTDLGFVEPNKFGHPDIICHRDAKPARSHVQVAAGDVLSLQWTPWPESHHGPVMTYLANCRGPCEKVDKTKLDFFKIDEAGLLKQKPPTFGDDILIANNNSWQVQIPKSIAPGNYVLRHEIMALHGAGTLNGAQAYPQCFNLKITGSGKQSPAGVKGTKLYKPTDRGILANIYKPLVRYTIPGPRLIPGVPAFIPQKIVKATATAAATPAPGAATQPASANRPLKGKKRTQGLWSKCGGRYWKGPTACVPGAKCKVINPYYSQCVPV
ncbi:hypothetical protein E4U41_006422 [Claviceps citrina]|nr:hypothetical protein E4U41_006422 [Claviceps citrina]